MAIFLSLSRGWMIIPRIGVPETFIIDYSFLSSGFLLHYDPLRVPSLRDTLIKRELSSFLNLSSEKRFLKEFLIGKLSIK